MADAPNLLLISFTWKNGNSKSRRMSLYAFLICGCIGCPHHHHIHDSRKNLLAPYRLWHQGATSQCKLHCSQVPWGPNFVENGDPMGTQFWVRWGPNGDHRQHKWGPKKRIFENLSKRTNSLQFHMQVFEYLSTKLNSTDMLAWDSSKLVLSSQVFKWSIFNR